MSVTKEQREIQRKERLGQTKINSQGIQMTIIEYINSENMTVEFNDDNKTKKPTTWNSWKSGRVRNPNFKKAYKTLEDKRVGSTNLNIRGELMKVIKYNNANDIIVEFQDQWKEQIHTSWDCFKNGRVQNLHDKEKGIINHPSNFEDLTGQTFNNLYVEYWDTNPPDIYYKDPSWTGLWKCTCLLCNDSVWGSTNQIKSGSRNACRKCSEKNKYKRKRFNKYDLSGEFGIGWTYNTDKPFYFDLEDYDLIKDYSWKEDSNGYAKATKNNKEVLMHRIVTRVTDTSIHVDHRCHNNLDNRKGMLRVTTCKNNTRNEKLAKNNTSGVTGVCWDKQVDKWQAYIWVDGKTIHLGRFYNFDDAVKARKEAEEEYFGEFSYDNSMSILNKGD